jgi:hypothetical protein
MGCRVSNFREIDQEIINGTINGCNYGGKIRVLARTNDYLLVWVPGSSHWSGMHGTLYTGAEMRIINRRTHGHRELVSGLVCDKERLHNRIFPKYAAKIDETFGEGFHGLLDTRKTVVVGDSDSFSIYGEMPVTGHEFGYRQVMEKKVQRELLISMGYRDRDLEMAVFQINTGCKTMKDFECVS